VGLAERDVKATVKAVETELVGGPSKSKAS
jgi:hypothetical protein